MPARVAPHPWNPRAGAARTVRHAPVPTGSPIPRGQWRVWGADAITLHDRTWALRHVQVIRPGGAAPRTRGPRVFLLVGSHDLVAFQPKPALDRLYWSRARAARVRVVQPNGTPYAEAVDCDGRGRLLRIRRDYSRGASTTARCWLTSDLSLARRWHAESERPMAWNWLARLVGSERSVAVRAEGRVGVGRDDEAAMSWLEAGLDDPGDLEHAFEGVYQFQPGVWVHESVVVPPGVRFAGPALVGAGVQLAPTDVVIGPALLADEAPLDPPEDVDWDDLETPTHRLIPRPRLRRGWWRRSSKRAFDVAASGLALACALPLFPIVMLLIWREDGRPFFFAHTRQTRGGREFPCFKFRTMIKDAERAKAALAGVNQSDGAHFFMKDDPRLLRVGKWLRRFQIDEIPQLWNILRGDMSVVGPRPSPDKENQFCPAWREARLSVRPGLTGLWQVRRTREPQTDFQEWIRYDLEYVQRESWRLDIWIILETIRTVVLGSGPRPKSRNNSAHQPSRPARTQDATAAPGKEQP
ncbi:MAG: sugar transferase [Phycisphaerales bacterium]|nr:sugar transferase [Phycisphaerales bacterium]MCB9840301.1 sugar transferase [Phycisphaeraceae bacterium]